MAVNVPEPATETVAHQLHNDNPNTLETSSPKKLVDRINDSFDEDDQDRMLNYLGWVRSAILDYMHNIRRNATGLLLLIAIFELAADSRNAAFVIGSFHVTKDSIVLVFLPTVVSFLYLQTIVDTVKAAQLQFAFSWVFDTWAPKAADNGLDELIYGPQPAYWSPLGMPFKYSADKFDRVERTSNRMLLSTMVFGVLAFEAQAYYVLFPAHVSAVAAWIVSLSATLFCLVFSMRLMRIYPEREYYSPEEDDDVTTDSQGS